jgi:hypothetical protein
MAPDELRPGMTGYGRTVMSGTEIKTFDFEVISVMKNSWAPKQSVILVRCSGLNLDHTSIIGGMSGSPCYVTGEDGKERMIGAVAYGWMFNKDPLCGLQPITQMLEVAEIREPEKDKSKKASATDNDDPWEEVKASEIWTEGKGIDVGDIAGQAWSEPLPSGSRFSIFNADILKQQTAEKSEAKQQGPLRPLSIPVMTSGLSERSRRLFAPRLEAMGMELIPAGSVSPAAAGDPEEAKLQPGSVICVNMMTGDLNMTALGTCTEVMGDKVLGFGHMMFGRGAVDLPMATGLVHMVVPSVMRSNKIGSAVETVGTLWGDENAAIFGIRGRKPRMVPLSVTINDVRGRREYNYEVAPDKQIGPNLLGMGLNESIYAFSEPPEEHHIQYKVKVQFEEAGTYRTSNLSSQQSGFAVLMDTLMPLRMLLLSPFEQAKVQSVRVDMSINDGTRQAVIDRMELAEDTFKPGEKVTVRARLFRRWQDPTYTWATCALEIPEDLPDGQYTLKLGSAQNYLMSLRQQKPHLFTARTLDEMLKVLNLIGSFRSDRLYLQLELPKGGLAVHRTEMPELPSFRQRIVKEAHGEDAREYEDSLVIQKKTGFVIQGGKSTRIKVSREAEK